MLALADDSLPRILDRPELGPEWFGIRLAQLIGMVDDWQGQDTPSDALQTVLHQEILMFDAITSDSRHPSHDLSRRQALATLAALPLAFATVRRAPRESGATTELFLSRCAASLTACWHILKGSDLRAVDQILSSYLLELEGIAQRQSRYQKTAARLVSQAHRICGIVALHRNQLRMREYHCKRALYYATAASDIPARVAALTSLASTYYYGADPAQAADVYEQALDFIEAMSPLQMSRVHAELSVVYGQLGREQETIQSTETAVQLYPVYPEQDASFLYAEFTQASLVLERGLSYMALAEHYPGRKYQQTAADIFSRVEQAVPGAVPDRIRYEIINHQAEAAILLNDFDAFEGYMSRGIDGVVLLGSRQRRKEWLGAWQRAAEAWPNERRLKGVREQFQLAITRGQRTIEGSI
jgi:tetratricopeptide (TPR) repeat protein